MKMVRNIVLSLPLLYAMSLLIGCKSKVENTTSIIEIDPTTSSTYDWLEITDTTAIALETSDECLIGQISEIFNYKSDWYILTQESTVLRFDKSGKFVTRIGSKGAGPGEFMKVNTMCVVNNRIYLNAGNQEKICIYDIDGNWIEDIKDTGCLKFALSIKPIDNDRFLVANGICFKEDIPLYGIWRVSEPSHQTSIIYTKYSYSGNYVWSTTPLAQYHEDYLALKPLSSTVYCFNKKTTDCDSLININGCIPSSIGTSGDYQKFLSATLSLKGNYTRKIHIVDDFVVISLLKAFALVHIPSGQWWYTNTQYMSLLNSPLPFILTSIECSFDDKLACLVTPSTYLNVYAGQPGFKKFGLDDIDLEDNPILMIYTLKYIGDK